MKLQLNINNTYPKKALGQNFIHDKNFLLKLNKFIDSNAQSIIIEIGPGKGALTEFLLNKKYKEIFLIEKDNKLASLLKDKYKFKSNLTIINDDALNFDYNIFYNKN